MRLAGLVLIPLILSALKGDRPAVRYVSYPEAQETLAQYSDSGIPGSSVTTAAEWDAWIREQDAAVRARIDAGVEDSISNLILFGTSFTSLPRIRSSAEAVTAAGKLTPLAQQRVKALADGLSRNSANERLQFVRSLLARKAIPPADGEKFLAANLARFAAEQKQYEEKLDEAGRTGDRATVFAARGTLYESRGLSTDASLLPNFALEETLRAMVAKGVLKPNSLRRIAVIGPGLDFADKREGYDFYPLQTIQPFAVMEAVLRAGLASPEDVQVTTLDLNGAVNTHVANLARLARQGQPYVIQLPHDSEEEWSPAAVSYWEHLGDIVGTAVKPIPVPKNLPGVRLRAIAVKPALASSIEARDLNVVAQTMDLPDGERFDLVVATNILVYYNRFEQALAMAGIARMMNPGGIFLANNALPTAHDHRLKFLGIKSVTFTPGGEYGDDVAVYQRE